MGRKATAAILGLLVISAGSVSGQVNRKPHVSWTLDSCMNCHAPGEAQELAPRVNRPCRDLCASCHGSLENHHPVGATIPRPVRPPLLLTRNNTNTCSTCHDVTRPAVESGTWVSQSLVQKLAQRSNRNTTFFLVMRNDRGQLCRNCH